MRFAAQNQAVEQHCRDADANRAVGQVEGRPMRSAEMEIEEIDNRAKANPIEDITHGPADDEPDRDGKQWTRSAAQPIDQDPDNGDRHNRKNESVEPGAAVEQAKADPAIVGQGEIKERGDRCAPADPVPRKGGENRGLGQLIENDNDNRRCEAARQHHPATTAQRWHRSVWLGTWPTSGSTLQQRSHRFPGAADTCTPTSGTSGSVKAPSGASSGRTVPAEVMQSSARSTSRSCWASTAGMKSSTAPCRLDPRRFAPRSSSSAPVTTRRRSRNTAQRSPSASSRQPVGTSAKSSRWTLRPGVSPCRASHASSAVKQITGASQRTR